MKKLFSMLLILCLMLPLLASAAEETLPRLEFPAANYVGYSGYDFSIQMTVRSTGRLQSSKMMELRDETGRVWATREFKSGASKCNFKAMLDASFEGGANLSVWCGDTQVSVDTAYVAVTDRHRKVIQTVATTEPYMSLSFDCAYEDEATDELLALLDEMNIKATFFMTGGFINNFPESAKKIRDAGHEIGCHSLSHPHLLEKSLDSRFLQVRRNVEIVRDVLGVNPRLFRPPFGEFNVTVSAPARAEGMEVCMWSIDSHDWDPEYDANRVLKRVTKNVGPGTIILFHLDGFYTCDILRDAVSHYRDTLGLELVPITELLAMGGVQLPDCPYEE